jgi:hypothetical protein
MVRRPWHRIQRGYLLEVPILLAVVVIVVAVVFPNLPRYGQKIFLGVAAIPVLFCLYYMIVIPGWSPHGGGRLRPPWSWIVFGLVAAAIIAVVVAFAFSG